VAAISGPEPPDELTQGGLHWIVHHDHALQYNYDVQPGDGDDDLDLDKQCPTWSRSHDVHDQYAAVDERADLDECGDVDHRGRDVDHG